MKRTIRSRRRRFDVAAIAETSGGLGRAIYRGISRYVSEHMDWNLHIEVGTAEGLGSLEHWSGDGLIARPRSTALRDAIGRMDLPRVVIGDLVPPEPGLAPLLHLPLTSPADDARAAFDHFIARHFRHFAFVPFEDVRAGFGRDKAFAELLAAEGIELRRFPSADHRDRSLPDRQRALADWLRKQPKPLALWAANDLRGQQVIEASRIAHLGVPEQVAILGHGNDELLCSLCTPQLSSVEEPYEAIGYEAARLLQGMMTGGLAPAQAPRFKPLGVATRRSTDLIAIEDPEVAQAMRSMREHLSEPINVADIARWTSISRSTLQRRFKLAIGRTPAQELARLRLERALALIANSQWTLKRIAAECGYGGLNRMYDAFRRLGNTTPGHFRRTHVR